ncbi:CpaD family pilus assembly lipoprotein [Kiloniella majae]|uniref:CpaD family pilus assembly lipoprotein n=1 Tax=Kiloniella majae TaxID=1938558 RepID=UPI000A278B9F|nr:CpaD family pilus assembly lipoprotein [Kiloniella majae]
MKALSKFIKKFMTGILVASAVLIGACAQQKGHQTSDPIQQTTQAVHNFLDTGRWQQIPSSKRTKTVSYIASEGFFIPVNLAEINSLGSELQDFIKSYNITSTDVLLIDGLRNSQGNTTEISSQAIRHLQFTLRDLGYKSKKSTQAIAILDPSKHNAALLIHRKIIIAPECIIKPYPRGARPHKRTFGCVQEVNLANMVASPEKLDGSQPMTSADSTTLASGVDRYRRGEITPLITNLSTSGI